MACICRTTAVPLELMEAGVRTAKPINGRARNGTPALELHLCREVFYTGRRLSGVVVLRLAKPVDARSLTVSVTGNEKPTGGSLARALRRGGAFFDRELLLSGALQPRLASDRASLVWNSALGRYKGRTLAAGEHTYPFSISLPASLPPSYDGRAGKIEYRVTARLQLATGRAIRDSRVIPVVFVPRLHRGRPVAVSYPTADGAVHATEIEVNIELPDRMVAMGENVHGRLSIVNPHGVTIPRITASLEVCEWVRLAVDREIQRERVDVAAIRPECPAALSMEAEFSLRVPKTAPPSIEGTAISVIWLLKLTLETDPPIEFKTPIVVYSPVEGQ
jgi:hypothetical protein